MTETQTRAFRVHVRRLGAPRHLVTEATYEAAVVAWLETWPGEVGGEATISVVVYDVAGGRELCFTIDLATGVTAPGA
jgi:hypothetical protein